MPTADPTPTTPFELAIERYIDAAPERVWQVMTTRIEEWWCPKPWRAEVIEQDWRPGGRSAMVMHGPNGEMSPGEGVFLEVVPGTRFVFTDAFTVGWKPQAPFMVGFFELSPQGSGTHYRAGARHWDAEKYEQHKAMGFEAGWRAAAGQLAALVEQS